MDTLVWVGQGVLTLVFFLAGFIKLAQSRAKIISKGGKWAEDFSPLSIKVIGAAEILLALGVSVPRLMGHGTILTWACASGIAADMVGAFFTHLTRKDPPFTAMTVVLFLIACFVAYSQFPFSSLQ